MQDNTGLESSQAPGMNPGDPTIRPSLVTETQPTTPEFWTAQPYTWGDLLPLPAGAKTPPPSGYTGEHGRPVTDAQRAAWAAHAGNWALRLPDGVVGLDVDQYGDKRGLDTLAAMAAQLGALPATWTTTSREYGTGSGIRFYRYPGGKLAGIVGAAVEVIQRTHRYAVVAPSVVQGRRYTWYAPNGAPTTPPALAELPELPAAWVQWLASRASASAGPAAPDGVRDALLGQLLADERPQCDRMTRAVETGRQAVAGGGARHDAMTGAVMHMVRLAAEGHHGFGTAVRELEAAWEDAIAGDPERSGEFARMVSGAAAKVAPDHPRQANLVGLMHSCNLAPAGTAAGVQPSAAADGTPADGWTPVDLALYASGDYVPEPATMLVRTDGVGLLYPGKVHAFNGEPESGKSMLAQWAVAVELKTGRDVLVLDFESDAATYVERLRAMGVGQEALTAHLVYVNPDTDPASSPIALARMDQLAASRRFVLAILDGVTEALALMGGNTNDGDDVTRWQKLVPRRIAQRTGAAVVVVDHVVKDREGRGRFAIGSQAKLAALTGAAYLVDVRRPLGRGVSGELVLKVAKDRPGYVRGHAGIWNASTRLQEAARVHVDGTMAGFIKVVITGPTDSTDDDGRIRLTGFMERISRALEGVEPQGFNELCKLVAGKREHVKSALGTLVEERYVTTEVGAQRKTLHTSARPYREETDPLLGRTFDSVYSAGNHSAPEMSPQSTGTGSPLEGGTGNQSGTSGNHRNHSTKAKADQPPEVSPEQAAILGRIMAKAGVAS